jgi:hypothetical protein
MLDTVAIVGFVGLYERVHGGEWDEGEREIVL